MDRVAAHLVDQGVEVAEVFRFSHEHLRRLHAQDCLGVRGGDPGIRLPHDPRGAENLLAEINAYGKQHRHDRQHRQRQSPIVKEHRHADPRHQRRTPYEIHHAPGQDVRQPLAVGREPSHQPADRLGVVEAEREFLQLHECIAANVVADVRANLARASDEPPDRRAQRERQQAERFRVGPQVRRAAMLLYIRDDLAGQNREAQIAHCQPQCDHDERGRRAAILERIRQELPPEPQIDLGFVIRFFRPIVVAHASTAFRKSASISSSSAP